MTPNVPLVAWDPDGDPTRPGVLAEVSNLIPTRRGFVSDAGGASFQNITLPDRCYGGQLLTLANGDSALLLATQTSLYSYIGFSQGFSFLALRNRGSGAYNNATFPNVGWRFAQFGEHTLAIQRDNVLQSSNAIGSTNFADVSGAPAAATMCVASNFVMVANTFDAPAANTFRHSDAWWCSALGNHANWTPDLATQCDRGRLRETPGPILRLFAYGPDVLAFKRNSIIRGRYVNRPADGIIWQWTPISTEIGIVGHDAICQAGGIVYFMSSDGVYAFNGSALRRIDSFPLLWYTRRAANIGTPDNLHFLTQAVYDPVRRVIRWHFVDDDDQQKEEFFRGACLTYHPQSDRWGFSTLHKCDWAINLPSGQYTLSDGGSYNTAGQQIGSATYTGRFVAGYVDFESRRVHGYSVADVQSGFVSGDIGDDDKAVVGVRARIRYLRAPSSGFIQHLYRMNLGENFQSKESPQRVDGKYDFAHSARWHRIDAYMNGPVEVTGMRFGAEFAGDR